MRLLRIRLVDVRGIAACEVRLSPDGVTIIEAPNESGKSTLFDAVDVLLEYKDTSRAQPVRSLQPVDRDVGSTVEVEFVCGDAHVSCTKTFNRQPATELHVHRPVAEHLTGAPAHDRLRTLLESEVDLDLFAALRFEQGRDLSAVPLQSSHVLADRLDAVAGGDGGTGGDDLLERVTAERQRYFTPGGKEGRVLATADAAVEDLVAHHADVVRRLSELDTAGEELSAIEQELPVLRRRVEQEVVPRLAELDEQLAAIATRTQAVAARRAEHEAAAARRTAALRERDDRHAAISTLGELTDEVASLEARLAPLQERRVALDQALEARGAELTAASTAADEARATRETAQVMVDLAQAIREHDQLAGRQERIAALQADARAAEAALAATSLDDDLLTAIREAEQQRRVAVATLEAGAPTVAVTPGRDLQVEVDGDPQELVPDGTPWSRTVADRLHLEVPDVLTLEVRAGGSAGDLQRAVDLADETVAERCRQAGVTDPSDAERVAREVQRHQATLERRDAQIDRELEGMEVADLARATRAAEDRVRALRARLASDVGPDIDLDAARAQLEQASPAEQRATDELTQARAAHEAVRQELANLAGRAATDEATLAGRREQLARDQAALATAREACSDESLEQELVAADAALRQRADQLRAAQADLDALDPQAVELDAQTLRQERDTTQERLTSLGERRAALRERLELAGQEGLGELALDLEQQLERARADQRRLRSRAAAAKLLYDELTAARDQVYRAYRAPLVERIVQQARLLYRSDDVDVRLGDDLAIEARTLDGITLAWEQLSAGAREQLAILSGLAAAQLAGADGAPFVLDDALGYTDPQRLERLGALLGRTTDAQVIVLTCVAERFRHVGNATTVRLLDHRGSA